MKYFIFTTNNGKLFKNNEILPEVDGGGGGGDGGGGGGG